MIEFVTLINPPYSFADVVYAWVLGMFSTIPLFIMVFWVLPWLSGWRKVTYNIHWNDTDKRLWIWKQVRWGDHGSPGRRDLEHEA